MSEESQGMIVHWRQAFGDLASPIGVYNEYRQARQDTTISLESWMGIRALARGYQCDDRQAVIIAHQLREEYWQPNTHDSDPTLLSSEWLARIAYQFRLAEEQWLEDHQKTA